MRETILLLYLNTGAGHLAPAKALSKALLKNYGNLVNPVLVNGFEETNKVVRYIVEDGYRISQDKMKWLFEFLYAAHKLKFIGQSTLNIISLFTKDYLKKTIIERAPSKVVIFHPFLIKPTDEAIKELGVSIPIITVVTDPYSPPPIWFYHANTDFILSTKEINDTKLLQEIDSDRLHVMPCLLDEKFSKPISYENLNLVRFKNGFSPKKQLILIIGGGDGIPKGRKILKQVMKKHINAEVAIVCGRNTKLFKKANKLKEKHHYSNLHVFGFIDNVYELINIADIVITKGGTSTILEILISKKVPVISDYIWEQEKGNVDFVVNNRLGIFEKDPIKIAETIDEIFRDKSKLKDFQKNISDVNIENGAEMVSKFVYEFN